MPLANSVILPIVFITVIHLPVVQQSTILFYFLTDVLCTLTKLPSRLPIHFHNGPPLRTSPAEKDTKLTYSSNTVFGAVAGGALGLLLILIKYILTRRELKSWEVSTHAVDGHTTWRSFRLEDDAPPSSSQQHTMRGIYDNWLLVRFSVAFFFMVVFQMDTIVIQISGERAMQVAAAAASPDLSAATAKRNLVLLIPSAFASALGLFTFGTTAHFRDTMASALCGRRRRRQQQREHEQQRQWPGEEGRSRNRRDMNPFSDVDDHDADWGINEYYVLGRTERPSASGAANSPH